MMKFFPMIKPSVCKEIHNVGLVDLDFGAVAEGGRRP